MMNTVEHTALGVQVGGNAEEREAALTELRKRLEDALAHTGLTKAQLAARAHRSRTTVHEAFKGGGRVPSGATVAALAGTLGLSAEQKRELLQLRRAAAGERAGPVRVWDEELGKPIAQWDPHDLEVHPAGTPTIAASLGALAQRALPGYVHRAHDRVLADAVREAAGGRSRMLVLVGSSSTGKTRGVLGGRPAARCLRLAAVAPVRSDLGRGRAPRPPPGGAPHGDMAQRSSALPRPLPGRRAHRGRTAHPAHRRRPRAGPRTGHLVARVRRLLHGPTRPRGT
ncbi:helix-turn-helix transcriptional regulator [Streptomyces sp. SP2-10]|uniref:helix-turn-helix transcriptional regulator n=1 Tax=Streptomyces sp. SP2-10 TaxID=2873385 RepID=UPI0027DF2083|nr:helix-turn-helix transcriptional regulator [Streptomyces sp. SP2-10]